MIFHGQDYIADQTLSTDFQLTVLPEPVDLSNYYLTPQPFFEPSEQEDLYEIEVGEGWYYEIPKGLHTDPLADVALKSVELGSAATFIKYDLLNRDLTILEGSTDNTLAGTYRIVLTLVDSIGVTSAPKLVILTIFPISEETKDEEEATEEKSVGEYYARLIAERNRLKENAKLKN